MGEVLDNQEVVKVNDWGFANDTKSHELIAIVLSATATALAPVVIAGLKELGKKLAEQAVDEATSGFVKWIISKFTKKQKEKKILDFTIKLNNGTLIRVDPPEGTSKITIYSNGESATIEYQPE